jgi:crotonobetainyl-CoA:carnitine CoA-transferase CaiB-like acyl-CoA transferase
LARRAELKALLEAVFRRRTVEEWMARLEARDVLCVPVNGYAELPTDAAVRASGMLVDQQHPRAGRIRTLATPIRFSQTPGSIRTPAPALGEQTDAVLAEAGVAATELAELRRQKVIA